MRRPFGIKGFRFFVWNRKNPHKIKRGGACAGKRIKDRYGKEKGWARKVFLGKNRKRLYNFSFLLYNKSWNTKRKTEETVRYIKGTFLYIFKNFIFLFAFVILPSYFLTAAFDPRNVHEIVEVFIYGRGEAQFRSIFSFFSPSDAQEWIFASVSFVFIVLCFPMLFGFIEKHMRLGIRNWKGVFGRFNYNFLTTLAVLSVNVVIYELWALITAGLVYAETLLLNGIACSIAVLITVVVFVGVLCFVLSMFLLWLPCLQITGYSYMDALVYSNSLFAQKKSKIFTALFIPGLICLAARLAVVCLHEVLPANIPVFIVTELIYLFLMLYICVLMFVVYFDTAGEERMDLKKKF